MRGFFSFWSTARKWSQLAGARLWLLRLRPPARQRGIERGVERSALKVLERNHEVTLTSSDGSVSHWATMAL
jgi:hypothetical protein